MLQFLVTSKVRRRLLGLLWAERKSGGTNELAELADIAFASAHVELKEMRRLQLVRVQRSGNKEVYSANWEHPDAELLTRLVQTSNRSAPLDSEVANTLRQKLVALGAPLRGVKAVPVAASDVVDVLAQGAELARRDAVVARSLPIAVWKHRDNVGVRQLRSLDLDPESKHALAFFLDLSGDLGGDRRLRAMADVLRDERLRQERAFFLSATSSTSREFSTAAKWGFSMNMDRDSFAALFEKFVVRD